MVYGYARVSTTGQAREGNSLEAQAKARQGTRSDISTSGQNFPEVKRATEELGKLAGVSRKTYEHATTVLDKAPEAIVEATRTQELSINAAYGVTKLPEEQQAEIASRITIGTRGKAEVPKDIEPQIIEAEVGEDRRHPKVFDDIVSECISSFITFKDGSSSDIYVCY